MGNLIDSDDAKKQQQADAQANANANGSSPQTNEQLQNEILKEQLRQEKLKSQALEAQLQPPRRSERRSTPETKVLKTFAAYLTPTKTPVLHSLD